MIKSGARTSFYCILVLLLLWSPCLAQHTATETTDGGGSNDRSRDYLSDQSVVMITGAAGFLGSELALALHRTYAPKRIILVDRMVDHPQTQEELALFEFQRQRTFHVLQTLGQKGRFYRADFSPMIPEYFDLGEVPVLDHIFRENSDITHVVHLADPYPHATLQIVPREKDIPKAGMMESLMEQLVKHQRDYGYLPHFSYASSWEVYPHALNATTNPINIDPPSFDLLREDQTLNTPSSLRGASKMIDEMIAKLYYDTKGIYSVGLRFFLVYGPWGVPGSPVFEMAERAVTGDSNLLADPEEKSQDASSRKKLKPDWKESIQDFVFIDDAVDEMMAAMQFRPQTKSQNGMSGFSQPHPVIFNVATGQGHSLEDVANTMKELLSTGTGNAKSVSVSTKKRNLHSKLVSVGVGSTHRAEVVLGYQSRVSLRDGIIKTLAWHYDRAFPYGGRNQKGTASNGSTFIASQGIERCLPYDKECLRGAPVFPCASECSHEAQCTKSYYDEIIAWTQSLTSDCDTVLYTVDLDDSLAMIPSTHLKLQSTSKSFLKGNCNLAFVSDRSHLVQNLKTSHAISSFMANGRDKLLRNGAWVLVPLNVPIFPYGDVEGDVLELLPKLSPGLFFGSSTKRAIYVDSDILLDSIPNLLREASTQPYSDEVEGATAMLIGRGTIKEKVLEQDESFGNIPQFFQSVRTQVQNSAYRMVRIAVADKLFGDGFMELLDSRWMVHTLKSDDARLFRCDVLGEVVQWEVDTDRSALEFVLGLHDMWSRVIAKASGVSPWWIGDNVVTVPEGSVPHRRLREDEGDSSDEAKTKANKEASGEAETDVGENEIEANRDQDIEDALNAAMVNKAGDLDETSDDAEDSSNDPVRQDNLEDSIDDDEVQELDDHTTGEDNERPEFVLDAGKQQEVAAEEEKRGESSDDPDDDEVIEGRDRLDKEPHVERDYSSYDAWMGILSSSSTKYFVRIVKSSDVGVASINQ
ncbi:NAD-dependent epimerase/dehydratase [Nitzschia inconspicua]|uniref:NAD-dependent epimerase/dehydratase n=1 Tax=Nitzschia inconspicua TaxID=303405 RepID=A0A9K3KLK0_9STRA|nr:NAD-dependent epimerase/dehydratase [Nitzschia inconspicua]